jgi:hypothetical protein
MLANYYLHCSYLLRNPALLMFLKALKEHKLAWANYECCTPAIATGKSTPVIIL